MTLPRVLGLGSSAGDDCAGWLIVQRLQDRGYPPNRLKCVPHPAALLDEMHSDDHVVICDACAGSGLPGTIWRGAWPAPCLRGRRGRGSHDLALEDLLELARTLDTLPATVELCLVEGRCWDPASPVAVEVAQSADRLAAELCQEFLHA